MKKSDLKAGMRVKTRDGCMRIVQLGLDEVDELIKLFEEDK